jgi:deoxycytidylate deaminase
MTESLFSLMQSAVDIVGISLHPTNKIAAALSGEDIAGQPFAVARVNFWPGPIAEKIGMGVDIGSASGTVHAETACILAAPRTRGAAVFVTDPPCPNCMKNMAEAGIKKLYIDHKGFDKDFAQRRAEDVEDMTLLICKTAGISVDVIYRKEKRIESFLSIAPGYLPAIEKPSRVYDIKDEINAGLFQSIIAAEKKFYGDNPFAVAIAHTTHGQSHVIAAEIHAIAGFTSATPTPEGKYNFLLQPVHRVLMTAARRGLVIDRDYLFSSRVPTAREQVNIVGAGFSKIWLGDTKHARDPDALQALEQLTKANVLKLCHPERSEGSLIK